MGRHDKPHTRLEIRCDAGIYERREMFRMAYNKKYKPELTRTEMIERAIVLFLNEYEYMLEE